MSPRKLDSVLARFEETIEKNNAAGVCSGMYLTNLASSTSPRRRSAEDRGTPKAKSGRRKSLETSSQIQPGTYRNMLKTTDATVSTADTAESDNWDPFNDTSAAATEQMDESFSSIGDCSVASFMDDADDDDEVPSKVSKPRRERPKDKKSSGRRGTRITKTEKQRRRESMSKVSKSPLQVTASLEDPENEEDIKDDEDDDGFALTYVSARDKFTALAKQNADRQLCKQPSRRKLLSGLKMASKENLMSEGSDHSSSSTQKRTLDHSRSRRGLGKPPGSSTTRRACSDNLLDKVESAKCVKMIPRSSREKMSSADQELPKNSGHNLGRAPLVSSGNEIPVKHLSSRTSKSMRSSSDHSTPEHHPEEAGQRPHKSHRQRSLTKSRSGP